MFRKRKRTFARAHALLEEIRVLAPKMMEGELASRAQLSPLHALQKLLTREIIRAERKIRRCKSLLKELESKADPEYAERLEERIEELRRETYTWRSFGDAIAFLFMDKFALKQTYYNTKNPNPKQDAGFLSGKEGADGEWQVLEDLHYQGYPALLTDLTNSIRHGDVCALIGPDPYLIEVKTGKLDRKGKRQMRAIKQLMSFFATDQAEGLRGFEKLTRVTSRNSEVTHTDVMNECIRAARKAGYAIRKPEDGVYYVAIADTPVDLPHIFDELKLTNPLVFFLNEFKSKRQWSPYSPFVLSIRDCDALLCFITGQLILMVIVELAVG